VSNWSVRRNPAANCWEIRDPRGTFWGTRGTQEEAVEAAGWFFMQYWEEDW
jgi:hypothetical protein